jgi:hypothetical protein
MMNREAKLVSDMSPNDRLGAGNDDLQFRPITLTILALLFSLFLPVSVPLAHLALSRNKHHPDPSLATKILAVLALLLSYVGIVIFGYLASRARHHAQ